MKLTLTYPASTGRNFIELFRVIDSLQLTADYQVATPADWQPSDDVIVKPVVPNDQREARFPKGVTFVKPYPRTTPQPDK
ncbi:MAG TPA: hypothetical protein VK364_02560 [Hymenobacter sp.]|nr:hypothetical protein [Hymenobacter sp.]